MNRRLLIKPLIFFSLLVLFIFPETSELMSSLETANNATNKQLEEEARQAEFCIRYDYQIHDALTSTKPPFDNYFNISRAIFPADDMSSKLINIWVHFTNSSVNLTQIDQRQFIWSRSCLYVSDRYLSLRAMTFYSLGTIWPDRRQQDLHVTMYTFCNLEETGRKLVDFLSTLEDIAIIPLQLNPSLNNVECVVESSSIHIFKDVKKAFPHICWLFWIFSGIGSYCISALWFTFIKHNLENNREVVKAMLLFISCFYLLGLIDALFALGYSAKIYQITYPLVYFASVILFCFPGYKIFKYHLELEFNFKNVFRCKNPFEDCSIELHQSYRSILCLVYPCFFIVIHNTLWVITGITTEPFWAIPVAISLVAVALAIYLLLLYCVSIETFDTPDVVNFVILVGAVFSITAVLFSFFLTGGHIFDSSLLSSTLPGILIVILSIGWKIFKKTDDNGSQRLSQSDPTEQA